MSIRGFIQKHKNNSCIVCNARAGEYWKEQTWASFGNTIINIYIILTSTVSPDDLNSYI